MSPFAPPLAGNRYIRFALTSNFSANRPKFSLPEEERVTPDFCRVAGAASLATTPAAGVSDNLDALTNLFPARVQRLVR